MCAWKAHSGHRGRTQGTMMTVNGSSSRYCAHGSSQRVAVRNREKPTDARVPWEKPAGRSGPQRTGGRCKSASRSELDIQLESPTYGYLIKRKENYQISSRPLRSYKNRPKVFKNGVSSKQTNIQGYPPKPIHKMKNPPPFILLGMVGLILRLDLFGVSSRFKVMNSGRRSCLRLPGLVRDERRNDCKRQEGPRDNNEKLDEAK